MRTKHSQRKKLENVLKVSVLCKNSGSLEQKIKQPKIQHETVMLSPSIGKIARWNTKVM